MEGMCGKNKSRRPRAPAFIFDLDQLRCFEDVVGAVLGDGAESFSRNLDDYVLIKLRYEDSFLLQVWLSLYLAARIKLRRTSTVRVASADLGLFPSDFTLLCHK